MVNEFMNEADGHAHKVMLQKNRAYALRKMTLTEDLLALLREYLDVSYQWEEHYSAVTAGTLNKQEEKESHAYIQAEYMMPLMEECVKRGWVYTDLTYIIPGAFETTSKQRWALYKDLNLWATNEYDIIPF